MSKRIFRLLAICLLFFCKQHLAKAQEAILAKQILSDSSLNKVKAMANALIRSGFNAGSGYGEVWIRDFNTFVVPACEELPVDSIKKCLSVFFQMQAGDGNIIDGYILRSKADAGYDYIYSKHAPQYAGHKNTVETDQESSLIQAVYKYVKTTQDKAFLNSVIAGQTVHQRMNNALQFLLNKRYAKKYGLLYGATTVDWGDVQPESPWGVVLDSSSHLAIDIYDNAMFLIAINDYLQLFPQDKQWNNIKSNITRNVMRHLWDKKDHKFIPHIYLSSSPFPKDFDENKINYHGGTATAIEAGLLNKKEIAIVNTAMVKDVKESGAPSIGLTIYPVYPEGFFKNKGMGPYSYQNGGDWTWFGARMITQLARNGFAQEAFDEIQPMINRVIKNHGFYEWYTREGKPAGSADFRGSAGVLYEAINALQSWAEKHQEK